MRKVILAALLCVGSAHAAATICYAVGNNGSGAPAQGTYNWLDNIWASSAVGNPGTCAALGGSGVTIWGQTATIPAGRPGTAGAFDRVVANTGVIVHITSGLGVALGETTFNSPGAANSLTINATNSSIYGAVVVDKGGLLRLHGASTSSDNYAVIAQYAVFQVMPGGSLWIGTAANSPQVQVNGRLYVGCGDQSSYPTPFCSGNAGAWVAASVGASLNFTAVSSLPTGLVTGDLVELSPTPQRLSVSYPYNINGVTPPPAPPMMPTTSDTGSSPMRTCGSVASCLVPNDTLLCVVAISGSNVSLGWPQGGTSAQPYCTGAETAMALTTLGKGRFWLKQPGFFWADPNLTTWNNAVTNQTNSNAEYGDAIRSGMYIVGFPISNAAGTGPGRYGDHSLTYNSTTNWGSPCTFLSLDRVTSAGCYIDWTTGSTVAYGNNQSSFTFAGSVSFTKATQLAVRNGAVVIPSGSRTYNELVLANSDFRYLYAGGTTGPPFIQFSVLPNTANNHIAVTGNTTWMSANLFGFGGTNTAGPSLTSGTVMDVTGNSFLGANIPQAGNSNATPIGFLGATSYIDISHNFIDSYLPLYRCSLNSSSGFSSIQTFDHITTVNNVVMGNYFIGTDNYHQCSWSNLFTADNRITGNGASEAIFAGAYSVAFGRQMGTSASANNVFRNNYTHMTYRSVFTSTGSEWMYNFFSFVAHHFLVVTSYDATGVNGAVPGGYLAGVKIHHNVFVTPTDSVRCMDSGYNENQFLEGFWAYNNTCIPATNAGGVGIGDSDGGSFAALIDFRSYANVFGKSLGLIKSFEQAPSYNYGQSSQSYVGWNSVAAGNTMYRGFATNPNGVVNPELNRSAYVAQGGANYNTSVVRNITGVTIQNPTYTSAQTGCLKFTYTSRSNMALAWSVHASCADGTSGFGTAAQLNFAGAGTTYTVSGTPVTAGATAMTITASTSSFVGTPVQNSGTATANSVVPAGSAVCRWVLMATGSQAGQAMAITSIPGTLGASVATLGVAPRNTSVANGDTFAIIQWEVRLFDSGGTNYVDVGIDARSLPTSSQQDNAITVTNADYCDSIKGCYQASVTSGLALGVTFGVTNTPLVQIGLPMQGGSSEQALCDGNAACGGTAYYRPSGTAWMTAGPTGSYIGAVGPPPVAGKLPLSVIW